MLCYVCFFKPVLTGFKIFSSDSNLKQKICPQIFAVKNIAGPGLQAFRLCTPLVDFGQHR